MNKALPNLFPLMSSSRTVSVHPMAYNNLYAVRELLLFVWLPFSRINLKSLNSPPTHFSFLKSLKNLFVSSHFTFPDDDASTLH